MSAAKGGVRWLAALAAAAAALAIAPLASAQDPGGGDPLAVLPLPPPAAPTFSAVAPASPANENAPRVRGDAPDGSTVRLYSTADCSGDPLAEGPKADFADPGLAIAVPEDSTTDLHATATDPVLGTSSCSTDSLRYVEDSTAPTAPTLSGTDPVSPSSEAAPHVLGSAEDGSTVRLYGGSDCTGTPLTAGPAATLAAPGLPISVPEGVTSIRATATDAVGNASPCSTASLAYERRAATPPPEQKPGGGTTAPPLVPSPSTPVPVKPDPGPSGGKPSQQPWKPRYVRLSNENTTSRWAYANTKATVRKQPNRKAGAVTKLRWWTEDGLPEVYLLLRSMVDQNGVKWVQLRLPRRPNGSTGWVKRDYLDGFHVVHTNLLVDKKHLTATLFKSGRSVFHARIGVGKSSTPTPGGRFWIREKLRSRNSNSMYGPLAFGTSAYSVLSDWPGGGVVGIHGTNQPWLIPGRPSHGCVRMRNPSILRLGHLMPIGTPVRIR